MKVRHKDHPTMICTVLDEGKSYYIGCPLHPDTERFLGGVNPAALFKYEWEPVADERWVDVTGECEVVPPLGKAGPFLNHRDGRERTEVALMGRECKGYRLRKMKACDVLRPLADVFIIEKKET
jgi:hypothetical protein